jgi:hypothetical protein
VVPLAAVATGSRYVTRPVSGLASADFGLACLGIRPLGTAVLLDVGGSTARRTRVRHLAKLSSG